MTARAIMDLIDYNEGVRLLIAGEEVQDMTLAEAVWTVMVLEVGRVRVSARHLRDGAPVLRFTEIQAIHARPDFPRSG